MLKIEGVALPPGAPPEALEQECRRLIRQPVSSLRILRRSVDARKDVKWIYTVAAEAAHERTALRRCRDGRVTLWTPEEPYLLPPPVTAPPLPVVVAGAGPAGLFAALVLSRAGARPILLERGRCVERRKEDVETFWRTGTLDPASNVQFGEGGAGAFSDGKLNTGTKDIRHRFILEELVRCGAPEDILIDAKPHVGTDRLYTALIALRRELTALGADIRFETLLTDLETRGGAVEAVVTEGPEGRRRIPCRAVLLAPGHSARDTFARLYALGVPMEAKPFAVGVRIEHLQSDMDAAQYKRCVSFPGLPAASYKLSCHLPGGRAAFSFCVCPGGEVVAAASEPGRVVTNGMSEFARDGRNSNGALLVNVTPEDFGGGVPDAIAFQRKLEADAYALGGGGYAAPAQLVGDFLAGRPSTGPGRVIPTYRPAVRFTDLRACLPAFVADAIAEALPILGRKLQGYDAPDAVLTAVESRSSSPVRILRGEDGQSALRGLYPCGEGAGYAGGILSAAADGMRAAERLCAALAAEHTDI